MKEQLELKLQKEKRRRKPFDRSVYIALTNEVNTALCSACKFYEGETCDNAECHHPLTNRLNLCEYSEPGVDCWGFRPYLPIKDFADAVGCIIQNQFVQWFIEEDADDGKLFVRGVTDI